MKYFLLSFLIVSCYFSYAQSSIYKPFPEKEVVWRGKYQGLSDDCSCEGQVCLEKIEYEYFLEGEKLFTSGKGDIFISGPYTCPPGKTNSSPFFYDKNYVGNISQDVSQKKVYLDGTLLYDFDLELGDTLAPSFVNNIENVVTKIDSILIDNEYHRQFWLGAGGESNYVSIIEGIGSTFGLLAPLFPRFENIHELHCVSINSEIVYQKEGGSCSRLSAIKENNEVHSMAIFPNPFKQSTTITVSDFFKNAELTVCNQLGLQVTTQKISGNSAILDKNTLTPGIYFISLSNKTGHRLHNKIVIE